jgi:hypothetical protein
MPPSLTLIEGLVGHVIFHITFSSLSRSIATTRVATRLNFVVASAVLHLRSNGRARLPQNMQDHLYRLYGGEQAMIRKLRKT